MPKSPSAQATLSEPNQSAFGEKKLNSQLRVWKCFCSSARRLQQVLPEEAASAPHHSSTAPEGERVCHRPPEKPTLGLGGGDHLSQNPPFSRMVHQITGTNNLPPAVICGRAGCGCPGVGQAVRRGGSCRALGTAGSARFQGLHEPSPQPRQRLLRGRGFQRGRKGARQRGLREKREGEKCDEQPCEP